MKKKQKLLHCYGKGLRCIFCNEHYKHGYLDGREPDWLKEHIRQHHLGQIDKDCSVCKCDVRKKIYETEYDNLEKFLDNGYEVKAILNETGSFSRGTETIRTRVPIISQMRTTGLFSSRVSSYQSGTRVSTTEIEKPRGVSSKIIYIVERIR